MIKKIGLYWHTLRYLKFSQLYHRLKFNVYYPRPNISKAPALRGGVDNWVMPLHRSQSLIAAEEFIFFGKQGSLSDCGWDGPIREKLWRYNQHYFDDLNACLASERYEWHLGILKKWVAQNPPTIGVGWEPYPVSLRIINWIKWFLSGNSLPVECIDSLAIQARFLSKRIEKHLLGNHILVNAKALIFAGVFFTGDEANSWLDAGLRILEEELPEQILGDGGHFELSPMYHSIVLEDILDLINVSQAWNGCVKSSVILTWKTVAEKMLIWLNKMTHPDGGITFFNDAAFNIAASFEKLSQYGLLLGLHNKSLLAQESLSIYNLEESGYIQLRTSSAAIFLDVGQVGPDYLPGHAHADCLSFELSMFSHRVIVNGGTSLYGECTQRLSERQTAAHSTVEVDQLSSSEVWGGFRVARRAKPFGLKILSTHEEISVACSHNGYARLKGRPIHHREWNLTENNLTISDHVTGGEHKSLARFILHPSVSIARLDVSDWCIYMPLGQKVLFKVLSGNGFVESASYAPEFGTVVQTQCLVIELVLGRSKAKLQWN